MAGATLALSATLLLAPACGLEQLGGGPKGNEAGAGEGGAEAGDGATFAGQGCGVESMTGTQLCAATSMCPNLVVDTQAFPHCGFRIRGAAVDLVCGCAGGLVCPMGVFTTCAQAKQLLTQQSEPIVCAQVNEGRCTAATPPSSTSGSSGSSGKSSCDKQCMQECGGGSACASLCNC